MSENTQEEKVIQILKDRGIIESNFDFTPYIFVIKEDKDYYEVVIDGTLEIKKNETYISLVNNKVDWKQSVMKEAEIIINQLRGYFQAEDGLIKEQSMKMLDKLEMIIKA